MRRAGPRRAAAAGGGGEGGGGGGGGDGLADVRALWAMVSDPVALLRRLGLSMEDLSDVMRQQVRRAAGAAGVGEERAMAQLSVLGYTVVFLALVHRTRVVAQLVARALKLLVLKHAVSTMLAVPQYSKL